MLALSRPAPVARAPRTCCGATSSAPAPAGPRPSSRRRARRRHRHAERLGQRRRRGRSGRRSRGRSPRPRPRRSPGGPRRRTASSRWPEPCATSATGTSTALTVQRCSSPTARTTRSDCSIVRRGIVTMAEAVGDQRGGEQRRLGHPDHRPARDLARGRHAGVAEAGDDVGVHAVALALQHLLQDAERAPHLVDVALDRAHPAARRAADDLGAGRRRPPGPPRRRTRSSRPSCSG